MNKLNTNREGFGYTWMCLCQHTKWIQIIVTVLGFECAVNPIGSPHDESHIPNCFTSV